MTVHWEVGFLHVIDQFLSMENIFDFKILFKSFMWIAMLNSWSV